LVGGVGKGVVVWVNGCFGVVCGDCGGGLRVVGVWLFRVGFGGRVGVGWVEGVSVSGAGGVRCCGGSLREGENVGVVGVVSGVLWCFGCVDVGGFVVLWWCGDLGVCGGVWF